MCENDEIVKVTFNEAVDLLDQPSHPGVVYDTEIDGHWGDLMTREDFFAECIAKHFINYDGYGDQVTEDGRILIGSDIYPSDITTEGEGALDDECRYVLWYNR